MKHGFSAAQAMTTVVAQSEEFKRLSSVGVALARSMEATGAFAAAAALNRSKEAKRLASVGVALAFARSEESRRLSSVGVALARSMEASGAFAAVAALNRSKEITRLSSVGVALVRSAEASGAFAAAAALKRSKEANRLSSVGAALAFARSEESRRLSSIGATIAHFAEASNAFGISASFVRTGHAYRRFIASTLKANSESRMGIRSRAQGSSDLTNETGISFSRLSRLSHGVRTEEPFSPPVADLIGRELGDVNTSELSDNNADERDEAATRVGFNPELIAFPRAKYDRVLFSAGFRLSFASVPVPQAIESSDPSAVFNPQHGQLLSQLEQRLRQVVEEYLEKLAGPNWIKQRIPHTVRKGWMDRQKEDRADGRPVYAAIQYANFMDLADVITRRDNWREAFQMIFRDPNDIAVSLHRLHPVRKALAHSRPLSRTDVLTLVSEATHIFSALGITVLR